MYVTAHWFHSQVILQKGTFCECDCGRRFQALISDWVDSYNHRWPHQALRMKTPAQAYESFKIVARPVQKPLDYYVYWQLSQPYNQNFGVEQH